MELLKNKISQYWIVWLLLSGIWSSCNNQSTQLPYYEDASFTPHWYASAPPDTLHTVPPFSFTDQRGKTINNDSLHGHIYVADFFFTTCPGICPKLTKNLGKVQAAFKDDNRLRIVSHSVTPWIDTVGQLAKYGADHGVIPGKWYLLTGPKEQIYQLARTGYFAEKLAGLSIGSDGFVHSEFFLLVDMSGHLRGIYNGTLELETKHLIEDIQILLKETG